MIFYPASLMNDIFKSKVHQSHFDEFGYVVVDAGLENEADEMAAFIRAHVSNLTSDFYYSLIANDLAENKVIREKIRAGLQSFYERILVDYKSLNESFLIKPAHTTDELLLHQDWCYTHEQKFHSLTLWMPLCDVDEDNGALFFVPGSHRWFNNLRSSTFPTARISSKDLPYDTVQKVNMQKGQVMLFHPAGFHGSYPNNRSNHRVVITSVILPKSADYIYFQAVANAPVNNVKAFRLDEDTFLRELTTMAVGADPDSESVEQFHYDHPVLSAEALFAKTQTLGKWKK